MHKCALMSNTVSNVRCAIMCKCATMCTRGNDYPSPQCDGPGHVTPQIIISCSTAITIIIIIYQFTLIIFPFTESFRPEMKSKTCCYLLSHCMSVAERAGNSELCLKKKKHMEGHWGMEMCHIIWPILNR